MKFGKMPSMTTVNNLCSPAFLYLAVSFIVLVLMSIYRFNIVSIITKIIFILLWTYVLNFICVRGYPAVSWALVLLPYVLGIMMFAFAIDFFAMKMPPPSKKMYSSQSDDNTQQPSTAPMPMDGNMAMQPMTMTSSM